MKNKVRKYMDRNKMTNEDFAKLCGCSPSIVKTWLSSRSTQHSEYVMNHYAAMVFQRINNYEVYELDYSNQDISLIKDLCRSIVNSLEDRSDIAKVKYDGNIYKDNSLLNIFESCGINISLDNYTKRGSFTDTDCWCKITMDLSNLNDISKIVKMYDRLKGNKNSTI